MNRQAQLRELIKQLTAGGDLTLDVLERENYEDLVRVAILGEVILPSDLVLLRRMTWLTLGLIKHRAALMSLQKSSDS